MKSENKELCGFCGGPFPCDCVFDLLDIEDGPQLIPENDVRVLPEGYGFFGFYDNGDVIANKIEEEDG